jgi:hypothetical protein
MDGPCKDCENRHEACWGTCAAFKEYRKPLDVIRQDRQRSRQAREFLADSYRKQNRKGRRK